jgi:hypothetical protein
VKPIWQQPFVNIVGFSAISVLNHDYVKPKNLVFKTPQHIQAAGTLAEIVRENDGKIKSK